MQPQNTISENLVNQQLRVVAFEELCLMQRGKRGSKHASGRMLCEAPVQHKNLPWAHENKKNSQRNTAEVIQ